MFPFRKILCPTDYSEPSYEALARAAELALHFRSELYVLNVVPAVPFLAASRTASALDVQAYQREMVAASEHMLDQVIRERVSPELCVRPRVVPGDPAKEIVHLAEKERIDLIVIATHGETAWRHIAFGSVTERVLHVSECPVLVVRVLIF